MIWSLTSSRKGTHTPGQNLDRRAHRILQPRPSALLLPPIFRPPLPQAPSWVLCRKSDPPFPHAPACHRSQNFYHPYHQAWLLPLTGLFSLPLSVMAPPPPTQNDRASDLLPGSFPERVTRLSLGRPPSQESKAVTRKKAAGEALWEKAARGRWHSDRRPLLDE